MMITARSTKNQPIGYWIDFIRRRSSSFLTPGSARLCAMSGAMLLKSWMLRLSSFSK